MKIKQDFVTNSSSCSYIVCIPDMEKAIEKISKQMILSEEIIDKFKYNDRYGVISFGEDYDEDEYSTFHKIIKILEDVGYPVMFDEGGSDNYCKITNIAHSEKLRERIKYVMKD